MEKYIAVAILPNHGLACRSMDGEKGIYIDASGNVSEMFKMFPEAAVTKHWYIPLRTPRIGTAESLVQLLSELSPEYAKMH